ncbi:MAG: type I pantothenate kinase [Acidobacteriota bacterium]|nr:type I pantothenate kinase [Acidobacteriota bacterium]
MSADTQSAQLMRRMFPDLYEKFSREQWAKLRANMPLEISKDDLDALRGLNDPVSIDEVEQIYLPLGRLLNIHVASTHRLERVKDAFLGRPSARPTYVVAVTGSVAVGKSTFSRVLAQVLSRWAAHPTVELVATDGFLLPNKVLEQRGLMERKGFPESYDLRAMLDFMISVRQGNGMLKVPVYSHDSYDIVPNEFLEIRRPEVLILEGLNLLQMNLLGESRRPKIFASDMIDISIYVDAEETDIRRWYLERFMLLKNTAFRNPRSFFHRYAEMSEADAIEFATDVWEKINLVNLVSNVAPTRERAQIVMQKGSDHRVHEVWLRRI